MYHELKDIICIHLLSSEKIIHSKAHESMAGDGILLIRVITKLPRYALRQGEVRSRSSAKSRYFGYWDIFSRLSSQNAPQCARTRHFPGPFLRIKRGGCPRGGLSFRLTLSCILAASTQTQTAENATAVTTRTLEHTNTYPSKPPSFYPSSSSKLGLYSHHSTSFHCLSNSIIWNNAPVSGELRFAY